MTSLLQVLTLSHKHIHRGKGNWNSSILPRFRALVMLHNRNNRIALLDSTVVVGWMNKQW